MAPMSAKTRIVFVSDTRNQRIAETHRGLLAQSSSYSRLPCTQCPYDARQPEAAIQSMERQGVSLAYIGIPGEPRYPAQLHGFMNLYAAVEKKPALGIVSHDSAHTNYVLREWMEGTAQSGLVLPPGAVSIIDARKPIILAGLEKALEILQANAPSLSSQTTHAMPLTRVMVDTIAHTPPIPTKNSG